MSSADVRVDHLITEARNPASANLDELTPLELVRLMNAEDARVIPAVATQAETIARGVDVIADRLRAGGRLVYVGAGTSGRLGVLDASECPPTFNSPPGQVLGVIAGGPEALTRAVEGAEDHPELAERDLAAVRLGAGDVLVGIATSGRTPYVLGAVEYARRVGAFTVGLSCNPDSDLSAAVDLAITVTVGPEVLSGSTRLKAGTATKLVLNTLTTGAMVRLGKTFGNLMVDLRATNNKLRARTNRILRHLTGVTAEEAEDLLKRCGGELKTALVARLAGLDVEQARERLQEFGGRVGAAVKPLLPAVPVTAGTDRLLIGIDGGGSGTVALLARAGGDGSFQILGRGEAGPSNVNSAGYATASASLTQAVERAFAAAGLGRQPATSACLGLAGADRPQDAQLIREWADGVGLAKSVEVTNDATLLLAAGTPEEWGLAIVAGTGSIAFGKTADGRTTRAGGWGYLLGDEGSAYTLVMAALQAVARAADDRGPPTRLTGVLTEAFGVTRPQDVIPLVYRGGWDRTRLASLAPLVFRAAETDTVAGQVVGAAAQSLAEVAAAVVRRLGWNGPVPLALAGGLVTGCDSYRARLLAEFRQAGVACDPVALVTEPAEGAIRHLLRAQPRGA